MPKLRPLPMGFYDRKAWHTSILNYYSAKPNFPSGDVLDAPIDLLTESIGSIVDIYGDFPYTNLKLLKQTINPLYDTNEYENMVYSSIKSAAIEESQIKFNHLADGLLTIRLLFLGDTSFISKKFSLEISRVNKQTSEDKALFFMESIRTITKSHITQIINIIKNELEKDI